MVPGRLEYQRWNFKYKKERNHRRRYKNKILASLNISELKRVGLISFEDSCDEMSFGGVIRSLLFAASGWHKVRKKPHINYTHQTVNIHHTNQFPPNLFSREFFSQLYLARSIFVDAITLLQRRPK